MILVIFLNSDKVRFYPRYLIGDDNINENINLPEKVPCIISTQLVYVEHRIQNSNNDILYGFLQFGKKFRLKLYRRSKNDYNDYNGSKDISSVLYAITHKFMWNNVFAKGILKMRSDYQMNQQIYLPNGKSIAFHYNFNTIIGDLYGLKLDTKKYY